MQKGQTMTDLAIGNKVTIKGREDEGTWEIYDVMQDTEGKQCYHIHQDDNDGCSDETGLYAEDLILQEA